ncbi:hypothetical protein QBC37DRAFT_121596 [Rhypophila decipiens]|uniref:Uncharacterized protein n=1 Tax=Rhypophila decipiens TaxID=261697 RepID=A0AAN7B994_9PEZI|nr:hypothetical protein QBC37DRAFT_121596 [Rhypophila decipiens]
MADSPFSTPKRKRSELHHDNDVPSLYTTAQFTFDPNLTVQDGSMSPRSGVAHRFRGLTLESGGGVQSGGGHTRKSPPTGPISKGDFLDDAFANMQDDMRDGARKRMKRSDVHMTDSDSLAVSRPATAKSINDLTAEEDDVATPLGRDNRTEPRKSPKSVQFAVDTAVVEQSETVANTGSSSSPGKPRRSISPPSSSMSSPGGTPRSRQRAGTPPLSAKTNPAANGDDSEETHIVDPVRASLTWHDDEITIYDPDDSDDDGTGINGIGFKPTPAIAYARTVRRRQQLAEYKKREEREARAKRNQRRRGSPVPGLVELKGNVERRRVRFMESATELISF